MTRYVMQTFIGVDSECPLPDKVINGVVSMNDNLTGSIAMYGCKKGYLLEGLSRRICRDGQWSGYAPTCKC